MQQISQKAKNSLSLKNRININNKYSKNDLNDWIFEQIKIISPTAILDLCCGRGNQTLKFAEKYPRASIYSLDISKESLEEIQKSDKKNIKTILMDLDSIPNAPFIKNYFDFIHCAYGLYYGGNYSKIIQTIYSLIKDKGLLMVTGPADDNNKTLFDFIRKIYPIDNYIIFTSKNFMNNTVLPKVEELFNQINKTYFYNTIAYPDANSLYMYIKSSTMYKEKFDEQLKKIINEYFKNNEKFIINKKAMAIIAIK